MLAEQERLTPSRTPRSRSRPRRSSVSVLIVDDDPCIRELLALHLRNAGYDVILAEDGLAAARRLLDEIPDLMLADVNMPYMSGFELVAAIRADATLPFFPVLFLTADTNAGERARELGAGCLTKPVRADRLLEVIAKYVRNEARR